jgi:hypothetical protein
MKKQRSRCPTVRTAAAWSVQAVLAYAACSCLPADTRPTPATILLTVAAPEVSSWTTVDGWTITIERLVAGVGNAALDDGCIQYSEGRYDRLLDTRVPGEQKLNLLFGLGRCTLRYRVSGPSGDTLVGTGVTDGDKLLMGTPARDAYALQPERVAVDLAASATRGDERAHLHWLLRQTVRYRDCGAPDPEQPKGQLPLEFASEANVALHIEFHGEALFREDVDASALRFDPVAAADGQFGDRDGEITLDELAAVPLAFARSVGPYRLPDEVGPGEDTPRMEQADGGRLLSLADYIVAVLMPGIAPFREPIRCTPFLMLPEP